MFKKVTLDELKVQMEEHLLMVEEVLGGLDQFVQGLERRVSRIEDELGMTPGDEQSNGWIAELKVLRGELKKLRAGDDS
jgi:hypothetical protein